MTLAEKLAVKAVTAKLKGGSKRAHVVFEQMEVECWVTEQGKPVKRTAVVGVWLDMEKVQVIAVRAARNKTGRSRTGAVNAELHFVK